MRGRKEGRHWADGNEFRYIGRGKKWCNEIKIERQLKRAPQPHREEGENQQEECVWVCVEGGSQVCKKKKVFAPQSVRVQTQGDRKCSKGDDEESGLKRAKEIRWINGGVSQVIFHLLGSVLFHYLRTVCPQSHCFWIIAKRKGLEKKNTGVNLISQSPNWFSGTNQKATKWPLNTAYCASAERCQTDGISDQCSYDLTMLRW